MSLEQLLAWIPPGHPDETLARQVNFERLPAHVAIIMDGNGRWAAQRHLPRVEGHRAGIDAVRDTRRDRRASRLGVLTLYAFSIENWKRPASEVSTLMLLLKRYLRSELNTLLSNDIRFHVIGRMEELAPDIQDELHMAIERTARNTRHALQHRAQLRRPRGDRRRRAPGDRVRHPPRGSRRGALCAAFSTRPASRIPIC